VLITCLRIYRIVNQTDVEINDFISLFIDIGYIYISEMK
jgi:hypothetical protein